MADRSRCPSCGARVSPYAAGCSVCGADLDPARWDTGPSAVQRAGSWFSSLSFGGIPTWAISLVVIAAIAIAYGLIG